MGFRQRVATRTRRGVAAGVGIGAGALLTAIAFAAADKPPPVAFLWVVAGAVLVALACVTMLPGAMARWDAHGAPRVLAEAAAMGLAIGALVAALTAALGAGDPSALPGTASRVLGLAAAAVAGAAAAASCTALARVADPRGDRRPG